jgi:hypothetical protein
MRPLDGVSPSKLSDRDSALQARFGNSGNLASPPPHQYARGTSGGVSSPMRQHQRMSSPDSPVVTSRAGGDDEDDQDGNHQSEQQYHNEAEALLARIRGSANPIQQDKGAPGPSVAALRASSGGGSGVPGSITKKPKIAAGVSFSPSEPDSVTYDHERGDHEREVTAADMDYYNSLVGGRDAPDDHHSNGKKATNTKQHRGGAAVGRGSTAENAARVDALLSELIPDKKMRAAAVKKGQGINATYALRDNKGGSSIYDDENEGKPADVVASAAQMTVASTRETLKKLKEKHEQMETALAPGGGAKTTKSSREYGLNAPGYFGNASKQPQRQTHSPPRAKRQQPTAPQRDMFSDGGSGSMLLPDEQSMTSQIASLKKELKRANERTQRLTEHSLTLGQTSDQQKNEITRLSEMLRVAHMDIDAKEVRAADAMRLRKKAQKKAKAFEEAAKDVNVLQADNERLRDREAALIEAVEALSSQNEDLIKKLKASMARELELSSLGPGQGEQHGSPPRAQSDTRLQRNKGNGGYVNANRGAGKAYGGGGGRHSRTEHLPRL